jgi:outer membrane protein assembly factor BamB
LNVGSPLVSSPLVHNGILVAATYDTWIKDTSFTGRDFILGIDTKDGTQVWSREIPSAIFSSPCLVNDGMTVVVSCMNKIIYALEAKGGDLLWVFETGGEVWSSPSYNGEHIFIGSDDGLLYCLDINGKLLWKTKLNGKVRSSSPCLSFYDLTLVE